MTQNNNLSVLPFYTDRDEQDFRKSYSFGEIYPLYSPKDRLLPFQILVPHGNLPFSVTQVRIFTPDGETAVAEISSNLLDGGLTIMRYAASGYDIIYYPSMVPMGVELPVGQYYAMLVCNAGAWTYYSEVFTVVSDLTPFLKIEWWSESDIVADGWRIAYTGLNLQFKNVLYLATELGKPDYEFEEDGEQRDGFFFPEKMLSEKTYKFIFLASEYICDVMRFIRMADYIHITDKYGREYKCDTFLMTPKWQPQGNIASVEVEFQTDTVAKTIGRALPPIGDMGTFNDDYNNDYDITNS